MTKSPHRNIRHQLLLLASICSLLSSVTHAFTTRTPQPAAALTNRRLHGSYYYQGRGSNTSLRSSLEDDNNTNNSSNNNIYAAALHNVFEQVKSWKWPGPPEDLLVMSGDLAALFVYCYLDHIVNRMYVKVETASHLAQQESLGLNALWLDHYNHGYIPPTLIPPDLKTLDLPCYSAMLHEPGVSLAIMTISWFTVGYFTGAFRFENTVLCDSRRALTVTTATWTLACAFMIAATIVGDVVLCGCSSSPLLSNLSIGAFSTLTKTDADFLVDSFSVLVTWRFVISYMLGKW